MRIIAGTARNRRLEAPEGTNTRPTLDRVRENLFNILQTRIRDSTVLDLFAGSGALSFEAISRGAVRAVLCDADRKAYRTERRNAESLGSLVSMTAAMQQSLEIGSLESSRDSLQSRFNIFSRYFPKDTFFSAKIETTTGKPFGTELIRSVSMNPVKKRHICDRP